MYLTDLFSINTPLYFCNEYFNACKVYNDMISDLVPTMLISIYVPDFLLYLFSWHILYPTGFLSFMDLWNE
jgi:hypothetical protein